jgi:hypothetical protein
MTQFIGKWANTWFGVDVDRFSQVHVVIYGVGIFVFLVLFILQELTQVISRLITVITYCFQRKLDHV